MKVWRMVLVAMAVIVMAAAPLCAADGSWGSDMSQTGDTKASGVQNPFSVAFRFLEAVLISAASGALIGARFMINMVKAYYSSDSQEGVYKKELIKFLVTVAIVMFAGTTLSFITGWTTT